MQVKILRTLGKIITLSLVTVTMTYGSNKDNIGSIDTKVNITIDNSYYSMSTPQLEAEVEKLSIIGKLPFSMGIELINRWIKEN